MRAILPLLLAITPGAVLAAPPKPVAAFAALSARYVDGLARLNPSYATLLGDHRFDAQVSDLSAAARAKALAFDRAVLGELTVIDRRRLTREQAGRCRAARQRASLRHLAADRAAELGVGRAVVQRRGGHLALRACCARLCAVAGADAGGDRADGGDPGNACAGARRTCPCARPRHLRDHRCQAERGHRRDCNRNAGPAPRCAVGPRCRPFRRGARHAENRSRGPPEMARHRARASSEGRLPARPETLRREDALRAGVGRVARHDQGTRNRRARRHPRADVRDRAGGVRQERGGNGASARPDALRSSKRRSRRRSS